MITALIGHRGVGKTALLKRAPQQKSSTSAGRVSRLEIDDQLESRRPISLAQ